MALANLKKGDNIVVVAGKEKGKRGKVERILADDNRVVVEKINMVKRHVKASQQHPQGGVIEKEAPLQISNVRLYCGKCEAPRRARAKEEGTGKAAKKVRVCVKCGTSLEAA